MTVNKGGLEALAEAVADEDLEKGLKLHMDGDAQQKEGNDPNGGLQKGGDGDEDDEDEDEDDDLEKSLAKILRGDDQLAKSIDAAPVLEALVDGLDEVVDGLRSELRKGLGDQEAANTVIADGIVKALGGIKALGAMVKSLAEQVEAIGGQPVAPRKSAATAATIEKSLGAGPAPGAPPAPGQRPAWAGDSAIVGQKLLKSIQAGKLDGVWATRYDHLGMNPAALPDAIIETIKDA